MLKVLSVVVKNAISKGIQQFENINLVGVIKDQQQQPLVAIGMLYGCRVLLYVNFNLIFN